MKKRLWSTLWLLGLALAAVAAPEGALFDWSRAKAVAPDILHASDNENVMYMG